MPAIMSSVFEHARKKRVEHFMQVLHVIGGTRYQAADRIGGKEAQGAADEMREDRAPHVMHDVLAGMFNPEKLGRAQNKTTQQHEQKQCAQARNAADITATQLQQLRRAETGHVGLRNQHDMIIREKHIRMIPDNLKSIRCRRGGIIALRRAHSQGLQPRHKRVTGAPQRFGPQKHHIRANDTGEIRLKFAHKIRVLLQPVHINAAGLRHNIAVNARAHQLRQRQARSRSRTPPASGLRQ